MGESIKNGLDAFYYRVMDVASMGKCPVLDYIIVIAQFIFPWTSTLQKIKCEFLKRESGPQLEKFF